MTLSGARLKGIVLLFGNRLTALPVRRFNLDVIQFFVRIEST
jgi:hypothetical protein